MSSETRREKFYQSLQSWASIAPLIACILGPLSILLGIPALTQRWRGFVVDNVVTSTLPDPALNIVLAAMSLACEVFANAILMLRFSSIAVVLTTRLSLALWIAKVAFCLGNYVQFIVVHPQPTTEGRNWIYLEGFWIGCASMVISAIVIVFLILNLTITPPRHDLGIHERAINEQHRLAHRGFMLRVLVLVLAMGFGSLAFCKLENFSFVTALYFVTASILTVGFGDVALQSAASKVILFPYLVFSITYVALLVTSIAGLIDERLDAQKQLREHLRQVTKTSVTQPPAQMHHALIDTVAKHTANVCNDEVGGDVDTPSSKDSASSRGIDAAAEKLGTANALTLPLQKTITLQEEIEIQAGSVARLEHRRQIRNILLALLFFSIFWFIGAMVFAYSEGWAYGESLYFCYVFFMTVGYGDYSAKSQLGRVLFIVYAMIAVPTVTFLVQVFVEAANVSKYVYNSKKSRQQRINELDTRELHEIKDRLTQETADKYPIGLRRTRTRSIAPADSNFLARSRTLSRSVTMENDHSIILTQRIQLSAPTSPRQKDLSAFAESAIDDTADGSSSEADDDEDQVVANHVLDTEVATRSRLVQNARKLDHLTRLLISPHLHQEARLLLSLEMGRLDSHYKQLLRRLSQSQDHTRVSNREWMEDTKEAEWLGLTGLERERKFVVEYRECFAGLLNDVESLVADVTPITASSEPQDVPNNGKNDARAGIRWAQ